jgi:hypothetical protein
MSFRFAKVHSTLRCIHIYYVYLPAREETTFRVASHTHTHTHTKTKTNVICLAVTGCPEICSLYLVFVANYLFECCSSNCHVDAADTRRHQTIKTILANRPELR